MAGAGYGEDGEELRPFNWTRGTTVALLAHVSAGGLLYLDEDASEITSFTDEKGTDLLKGDSNSRPDFGWPKVSEDGKACALEITSSVLPAKGATELRAEGTLVLVRATKKETHTVTGVALAKGTKFTVGNIQFEVTKAEDKSWPDIALDIKLKTDADLSAVAAIRFLDANKNEVPWKHLGSAMMTTPDGKTTSEIEFGLTQKREIVDIAVDVWLDPTQYQVPFKVKATLGL